MPLSKIQGLGFNRLLRRLRADGGTRAASRDTSGSLGRPEALPASGLRGELVARLAGIDLRREESEARAVDVFVACVLSREFGDSLMASAPGQELLRQVREAMLAAPKARAACIAMIRTLVASQES